MKGLRKGLRVFLEGDMNLSESHKDRVGNQGSASSHIDPVIYFLARLEIVVFVIDLRRQGPVKGLDQFP